SAKVIQFALCSLAATPQIILFASSSFPPNTICRSDFVPVASCSNNTSSSYLSTFAAPFPSQQAFNAALIPSKMTGCNKLEFLVITSPLLMSPHLMNACAIVSLAFNKRCSRVCIFILPVCCHNITQFCLLLSQKNDNIELLN